MRVLICVGSWCVYELLRIELELWLEKSKLLMKWKKKKILNSWVVEIS